MSDHLTAEAIAERLRALPTDPPDPAELSCPSVDVCGWCGDSECDGIGCIALLDPNDERDHEAIEQLHAWLRRGRVMEQAERFLAIQENRA